MSNENSATETAKGLWNLLLPHGLKGGAISTNSAKDDVDMGGENPPAEHSWTTERIAMWFQFLDDKGLKGISRDSWLMVSEVRLSSVIVLWRVGCSSLNFSVPLTIDVQTMIQKASFLLLWPDPCPLMVLPTSGAWPSTIDDFVESQRQRSNSDLADEWKTVFLPGYCLIKKVATNRSFKFARCRAFKNGLAATMGRRSRLHISI